MACQKRKKLYIYLCICLLLIVILSFFQQLLQQELALSQVEGFWSFDWEGNLYVDDTADDIIFAEVLRVQNRNTGLGDTRHALIFYRVYTLRVIEVHQGGVEFSDEIELKQVYQIRHIGILGEQRFRRQNIQTTQLSVGESYMLSLGLVRIDRNILRTGQPYEQWGEPWFVLVGEVHESQR